MSDRPRRKPDPLDEEDDLLAPEGEEPGEAGGAFVDEEPEPPPTPLDDAPADGAPLPEGAPHDAPAEPADRRDWSVPVGPAWNEEAAAWEDDEEDLLDGDDALDDLPDLLAADGEDAPWEADEAADGGPAEDGLDDDGFPADEAGPDEAAWAELEAELPLVGWREAVDLPELGLAGVPATCDPTRADSWARLPPGAEVVDGEPVELRLAGRTVRLPLAVRRDAGPVEVHLGRDALAGRFLVDPSRDGLD